MRCPSNTPGESFPRLAGQDAAQAAVDALAASSRPFNHHHPQVQGRISRCSKERGRPRPQASPRPTLSFGLAKRWVAKNGMDSPALILLPMIHPLRSATPLNSKAGHGARTPSSASLSMTNSAETPGKKMDGKKMDHTPANDPSVLPTPERDSKAG